VVAATLLAALSVPRKALAEDEVPLGQASRDGALIYTSPNSGFSFAYPDTMKLAPKLVKTHLEEVSSTHGNPVTTTGRVDLRSVLPPVSPPLLFFSPGFRAELVCPILSWLSSLLCAGSIAQVTLKSEVRKGFSVGVAVDPVRIAKIEDIGGPDEVGRRIVALEQKKDGVMAVELLDSRQAKGPPNAQTYYYFDYSVESTRGEKRYLAKAAVQGQRLYVLTVEVRKNEYDAAKPEVDGILESFRIA
jgi:hypothetical protein